MIILFLFWFYKTHRNHLQISINLFNTRYNFEFLLYIQSKSLANKIGTLLEDTNQQEESINKRNFANTFLQSKYIIFKFRLSPFVFLSFLCIELYYVEVFMSIFFFFQGLVKKGFTNQKYLAFTEAFLYSCSFPQKKTSEKLKFKSYPQPNSLTFF